jgi:hypothetical protein
MEANASRYHGKAPDELDWTEKQRQKRAVAEYLAALGAEAAIEDDASNESGGPESKRQRRYEREVLQGCDIRDLGVRQERLDAVFRARGHAAEGD